MAHSINTQFILPFIEATHSTFELMMNRKVKRKDVYIKKNFVMFGDISGVVGVSGHICGTSSVSLPADFAVEVIGDLMGEEIEGGIGDTAVQDGVGEIINMITGGAKTALGNTAYKMEHTLPTIITGRGHELYYRGDSTVVSMIFETDRGEEFALDVCMQASGSGTE